MITSDQCLTSVTERQRLKGKFSYVGYIALLNVILGQSLRKTTLDLIRLRAIWRPQKDGRKNNWRNLCKKQSDI